ncbi:hypothetical protein EYF80_045645 [Liparis tanakae]|uniref:Uncharacterized protein n=1 Tax=Liparis tanakae TaxID=230148 RepID=A0A4Z2FTI1_9TELE|nr:hypothetical protein EYF80_045645 [Liparis tanakae]
MKDLASHTRSTVSHIPPVRLPRPVTQYQRVPPEERDGSTQSFKPEARSPNEDGEAVVGILQSTRKSTKKHKRPMSPEAPPRGFARQHKRTHASSIRDSITDLGPLLSPQGGPGTVMGDPAPSRLNFCSERKTSVSSKEVKLQTLCRFRLVGSGLTFQSVT